VVGETPLYFYGSYVPIERIFDGTDQENSKTQGKRKNGGKKKKRCFYICGGFPHSCVLHLSGTHSG